MSDPEIPRRNGANRPDASTPDAISASTSASASVAADKYDQMLALADLFDSTGTEMRARARLGAEILADPDSHLMLAQSACAVVGQQGTAEDVVLLEKLQNQGSRHKSPAARAALDRLRAVSATR